MEGAGLAVLLLCLLPVLAQEVVSGSESDLGTQSPAAVSHFVTPADQRSSSSGVEFASVAPGDGENGTIAVMAPPASEASPAATVTEPGASNSTGASPEPTSGGGTSSSLTGTDPETPGPARPNLTQPPPTTHNATRSVTQNATAGPLNSLTESPLHPRTSQPSTTPTLLTTGPPSDTNLPITTTTTTLLTSWTSAITTSLLTTTTVTTVQPTNPSSPARPHTTRAQGQRDPPLLEASDNKEMPSFHSANSSNPLFVMIVSVFTIVVVMVVVVVGFRRYKKRNRRTEFRRLQDLPMDDMMEDTPLSLYSY